MTPTPERPNDFHRLRFYASDGVATLFRPSTGLTIRWAHKSLRHLRPAAPRVVFAGLSHACNLDCWFCSRDQSIRDRWTAGDILELLSALCEAGTQEVAFGGGEPLAYAGFIELLEVLAERTPLALHFTTNGTLLTDAIAERLARIVGEVRVSIYESQKFETPIRQLTHARVRTGANIVVTRDNVGALVPLLRRLTELGCDNAALLRYLGPEEDAHLRGSDWLMLEHAIVTAPLTLRLSKCFSDRLPTIPRAPAGDDCGLGGDCGAGLDFLTIDPSSHFRACSFHHEATAFSGAEELLARFGETRQKLAPARSLGCARSVDRSMLQSMGPPDSLSFYSGFASNNSGDTVLVADFETESEASEIAERLSQMDPETDREAWHTFLIDEGCDPSGVHHDATVAAAGPVLLATGSDAGDALSGLRDVLTRRGARVVRSEVFVQKHTGLLVGMKGDSALEKELRLAGADEVERNRGVLFAGFYGLATARRQRVSWWKEELARARSLTSGQVAAELVVGREQRLVDGLKSPVENAATPAYFQAWFREPEYAHAFAVGTDQPDAYAGRTALVRVRRFRQRLAVRAQDRGGIGVWLPGAPTVAKFSFYRGDWTTIVTPEEISRAAAAACSQPPVAGPMSTWGLTRKFHQTYGSYITREPERAISDLRRIADFVGSSVQVSFVPAHEVSHALQRITRQLRVVR